MKYCEKEFKFVAQNEFDTLEALNYCALALQRELWKNKEANISDFELTCGYAIAIRANAMAEGMSDLQEMRQKLSK
jgi:hypothetical protein